MEKINFDSSNEEKYGKNNSKEIVDGLNSIKMIVAILSIFYLPMIPVGFVVGGEFRVVIVTIGATTCLGTLIGRGFSDWIDEKGPKSIVELSFFMAIIGGIIGGLIAGYSEDISFWFFMASWVGFLPDGL